jgi:diguanylate cyclase (GGDEF)-like protein
MEPTLILIALQQGLFATGWWVAGWRLGLSRPAAAHWVVATLASALALAGIVQRGVWPDIFTYVLANAFAMLSFVSMRRGVQVFLRLRVTDGEHVATIVLVVAMMLLFPPASERGNVAVIIASGMLSWTMFRTSFESHRALTGDGDPVSARIVSLPLALLGLVYAVRVVFGMLEPDVAARPINERNSFNIGIGLVFMVLGLVLNMVLYYLVANRMVRRLHQLSLRDALTGLLNRRALMPLLAREARRLKRYGEGYAVLMIDIDHFKRVNDTHGHATGDEALVTLSGLLREAAREVDQVARIGGEEFCVLLPHTQLDGALKLGHRVQHAVRSAPWQALTPPLMPLTVSIGVAVAGDPQESIDAVMQRADTALYRAKALGRDRVVLAAPASLPMPA